MCHSLNVCVKLSEEYRSALKNNGQVRGDDDDDDDDDD